MILADKLREIISLSAQDLTVAIRAQGYKEDRFTDVKFTGMTNDGQFCYLCSFPVEGGTSKTKVFLSYDPQQKSLTADY